MSGQSQMTPEQQLQYAAHLIRQKAAEEDYLGIFEAFEAYPDVEGDELSEEDGRVVDALMRSAKVIVLFPGEEQNVGRLLDIVQQRLERA